MRTLILAFSLLVAGACWAQSPGVSQGPSRSDGTLVLMTGSAELEVANDEALAGFYLEVQDADLAKAQSQVNQRVAEGVAQLKRADPNAQVETTAYTSYPVYARENRKITGWRVRQSVTLRTAELGSLARTVAAAQQTLALGGVDFRLSRAARERVEAELIKGAIANLNARVGAVAQAMNVPADRLRTEELNFGVHEVPRPVPMMAKTMEMRTAADVAEPQFDPGRSLQQLTVTGRVRLPAP